MADIWMSGSQLTNDDKIQIIQQIKAEVQNHHQKEKTTPDTTPPPTQSVLTHSDFSDSDIQNMRLILQLPQENRVQALRESGLKSFPLLKKLFFNKKETMNIRWISLTSMARLYPKQSLPIINNSLKSPVWFLRNAGLVSLEIIDPPKAVKWAGRLLKDPSLIIRTAAVNLIQKHKASEYKTQLQKKLNAKDSFLKNESLWIRHHIVSALATFAKAGEEPFFVSLLDDKDTRVQHSAVRALEKITGKKFHADNNTSPTQ